MKFIFFIFFCTILSLYSSSTYATIDTKTEQALTKIMAQYKKIFEDGQYQYIESIFSPQFIKNVGGNKVFTDKIKSLPHSKSGLELSLVEGLSNKHIKLSTSDNKNPPSPLEERHYILVKEKKSNLKSMLVLKKNAENQWFIVDTTSAIDH